MTIPTGTLCYIRSTLETIEQFDIQSPKTEGRLVKFDPRHWRIFETNLTCRFFPRRALIWYGMDGQNS